MGTAGDDERAQTATVPDSPAAARGREAVTLVGRYQLERELGAGGMGVVHVAYDPALERRVALKLLLDPGGSAAQRLHREARAMARLTHPNVVTVHEVGTADGRDYVAMELVEGETLAEWLRSTPRATAEIIDAFIAAGRGLAAAHDAGIVHRDFKPHNVLRSSKGRIAVTDFGIAREATTHADAAASGVMRALSRAAGGAATRTPTPLAGLTHTGAVIGTPAYMAPEQWEGAAVTPATDQFGFCIALWEALAGSRPYRADDEDELRAQVMAGPSALDASVLPRRLRAVVLRGLDPDPALRWPSMHAVIAELAPPRRRGPIVALIVAALAVTGAVAWTLVRSGTAGMPCPAPALDPEAVWSSSLRSAIASGGQANHVPSLDAELMQWRAVRSAACADQPALRAPQLDCLDSVLVRFDAVARALETLAAAPYVDAGKFLIDPKLCTRLPTPRLTRIPSLVLADVIATTLREEVDPSPSTRAVIDPLIERTANVPCASALAHLVGGDRAGRGEERDRAIAAAEQAVERCGDDRVRAEVALEVATRSLDEGFLAEARIAKVNRADAAAQQVGQPDLVAAVDTLRASIAERAGDLDEAIARTEAARAGFAARPRLLRELRANLVAYAYRRARGKADDVEQALPLLTQWRARAVAQAGGHALILHEIDSALAANALDRGDSASASRHLEGLRFSLPQRHARAISGRVVDEAGVPAAGATVVAGSMLFGTSTSAAVLAVPDGSWRETRTAADGTFSIVDGPASGTVIASVGPDRRSLPAPSADRVDLVLRPTSRIEGRVELDQVPSTNVSVSISLEEQRDLHYGLIAVVRTDGRFEVAGVARGRNRIVASVRQYPTPKHAFTRLEVHEPAVRDVVLHLPSASRKIHVVVRSTVAMPVPNADVHVVNGDVRSMNARDFESLPTITRTSMLAKPFDQSAPPSVRSVVRPGELFVTLDAPEGVASACAIALPADLDEQVLRRKIERNPDKIWVECVPLPPGVETVVVEVAPFPRLE